MADSAAIRFLDANTQAPLGADILIDLTNFDTDWMNLEAPVPNDALGQMAILEIQFTSGAIGGEFTGLSVDTIQISAN